jgi:hypothetical protein
MVYHPDLTPFPYFSSGIYAKLPPLAVGWLSAAETFSTGETPETFQAKLLELCADATIRHTLGYHFCEFCGNETQYVITVAQTAGKNLRLGNGEIWTIGKSALYAAPTLIYHYVTAHEYRPPDDYIESVLATGIDSAAYHDFLEHIENL